MKVLNSLNQMIKLIVQYTRSRSSRANVRIMTEAIIVQDK